MRVIGACNPLAGQVFKVLRQTRHVDHEERRWVVQLSDPRGAPVSLPLPWAFVIDDTTDPDPEPIEPEDDGPCVDVTALQNLAIMVARLHANPQEARGSRP